MKVCVHLHTDDHLKEMSVCDGRRGSGGKGTARTCISVAMFEKTASQTDRLTTSQPTDKQTNRPKGEENELCMLVNRQSEE